MALEIRIPKLGLTMKEAVLSEWTAAAGSFVEKGQIINISKYWMNPNNLKKIIFLELRRHQIPSSYKPDSPNLDDAAKKIYEIFKERSLKLNPAYVRKLIESIINIP